MGIGRGVSWGVRLVGGQGGCERRIKFLLKFKKKKKGWGGRGSGGGVGSGGRVWGRGVRADVNEELKFLGKFTQKKIISGGREGGQVGGRVGGGGSG